jgi:hypothetical protein
MESSDIFSGIGINGFCEREFGFERRSQQQFCRCVVECGAARDRGRLCRILAFARAESKTIDGNGRRLFTREFSFGTRAEFGFCGRRYSATETSDTSQVASAESVSSSQESSVSEKESSDISQESASTVSAGREFGYGRRSQQQFCRCVVECGAARDRGRLCRILAFARAESKTIDGNGRRLFTREFGFGIRAEFGFCGRRIQRNRNVRYFSGCECRKCFEFGLRVRRRVRFRKRKAVIFLRNRHQRFLRKRVRLWEKKPAAVLQMCRRMWSSKRPWKIM